MVKCSHQIEGDSHDEPRADQNSGQRRNQPAKEIKVFGSSILINCYSRAAADKFAMFGFSIRQASRARRRSCHVYAKENKGSCLADHCSRVARWRGDGLTSSSDIGRDERESR